MSAVHFRKSQNGQLRQLKTQAEHGGSPGAKMAMNGPPAGPFEPIFRWDGDRPSRRVSISYVGPFASISVLFLANILVQIRVRKQHLPIYFSFPGGGSLPWPLSLDRAACTHHPWWCCTLADSIGRPSPLGSAAGYFYGGFNNIW